MLDWLSDLASWFQGLSWQAALAIGLGVFLVSFVGSLAFTVWMLIRLPPNFLRDEQPDDGPRQPVLRILGLIIKNIVGLLLVGLGVLLSLPGIPGQGILTILIGLMLMNFPGKRKLEKKLLGTQRVLRAVNGLRERFGRPPILPE